MALPIEASQIIAGLSNAEFAEEFDWLRQQIEIDPMKNFIEHPLFINFNPTAAQRVALKTAFCQELDYDVPQDVWTEIKDAEGKFDLKKVPMTETHLFKLMTDKTYDYSNAKTINNIDLICGRRSGKCQSFESLITLADGSREKIGDLIGKSFEVMAYDEVTGKQVKACGLGIDNGIKEVFKITTRSGLILERTANHPFMTEFGWKSVETGLSIGNSLQSPRKLEVFGDKSLFTTRELKLLGYFIGDGSLSSGQFAYTQLDNICAKEFQTIIKELDGKVRVRKDIRSKASTYHPSKVPEIREMFKRVGLTGKKSPDKFIPDDIFKSPKKDIALFLNRLFSTDGSLYCKKCGKNKTPHLMFEYSSASRVLCEGIKHLLSRFGIITTLRDKWVSYKGEKRLYFTISTGDSEAIQILLTEIGILGKSENKIHSIKAISTNHPTNTLPKEFWNKLAPLRGGMNNQEVCYGKGAPVTRSDFKRLRKQYGPSKLKFQEYLENVNAPDLLKTVVSDYWFDEIVSIESMGLLPTAGIEVEKYHTYINDVVEHNTTIASMLSLFYAIVTNWKPYLQKTPFATVLILSHSKEFSDEVLEIIRTFVESSPVLKRLINVRKKNTTNTLNLSVPFINDGKISYSRVQIKVGAASSKTTRGIAACCCLLDEIAYWNVDENMKETDEKIVRAVRPAMKQFGKKAFLVKLSSPGIKQGILYNEYIKWGKDELPQSYAVFKAPSWVWNTILPKEGFIEEWNLDPDGFDTEYRANFVDSLSNFILPEFVDMAITKGQAFRVPEGKKSQVTYRAAIDAAFKGDVFTFSVVGHFENRIKQYILKGWQGSRKNPVEARECAEYIRAICKEYGIDEVAADQFAFEPLREIFSQYGVTLVEKTFTPTFKKQIYFNLKRLIHSQQIDLLDHEVLAKEIKELVVEQSGNGQIKIGHPSGGHDDYSDSTAIAAYLAVESAGTLGFSFESSLIRQDYGVATDVNGKSFVAPPPALLAESYGYDILDNSSDFEKDPKTGRLKRKTDPDDEEDEDDDGPAFLI